MSGPNIDNNDNNRHMLNKFRTNVIYIIDLLYIPTYTHNQLMKYRVNFCRYILV